MGFRRRGRGSNRRRGGRGGGVGRRRARVGIAHERSHGRGGGTGGVVGRAGFADEVAESRVEVVSRRRRGGGDLAGGRRGEYRRRRRRRGRARGSALPGWASRGKSTRGGLAESLRGGDGGSASDAAARGGRTVRGARRVRARRRSRRGGRRHGSASEGAQRNDRRRVDSRRAAADASEGAPRGRDARRWSRGLRPPIARPPTHSRGRRRRVVLRGASNLGGRCVGRLNQTTTYPYARVLLIQRNGRRCANTARSNRARRSRKRNTSIVFETVEREISMRSAVVNSPAESDVSPGGLRFWTLQITYRAPLHRRTRVDRPPHDTKNG